MIFRVEDKELDSTMSIHFNIPSSEKQENSLECLTKRTSSLSYEWRRIVLLCQTASQPARALVQLAVLETMLSWALGHWARGGHVFLL